MRPILLLLLSVASASAGQVMFKKGVLTTGEITLKGSVIGELLRLIFQPLVFSGLILYVISTILWLMALSKTTLSFAYPFTALTFILVMLSSRVIFLESIPTLRYFGIVLIVLGILLTSVAKG
jgi:drug/metabolite transporter (DMT)-like permease